MPRPQLVTLRYLTRFACTGAACPDNCCRGGWRIDVDEGHYRKLKRALPDEEFTRAVARNPDAKGDRHRFALLVLDERGACSLLDGQSLCTVHSRWGAALLPDACALYPRTYATVGDRVEMTSFLSCPEAARLALLDEDALDLIQIEAAPERPPEKRLSTAPRKLISRRKT